MTRFGSTWSSAARVNSGRDHNLHSIGWTDLAGETLYGLSKHRDVSRNVIRLGIARYGSDGALDDDTTAADLLQDYKARLAGKLAVENEFLKGTLENARLPNNAPSSMPGRAAWSAK